METVRGQAVVAGRLEDDVVVAWEGDRISYVGPARPGDPEAREEGYILPGLVDLHSHGGGGASFPDATSIDDVKRAAREHLRGGTTVLCATMSTMELSRMEFALGLLAQACEEDLIEAVEIEGPFLSRDRCGAQNATYLLPPNVETADLLLDAACGRAWAMASRRC